MGYLIRGHIPQTTDQPAQPRADRASIGRLLVLVLRFPKLTLV
jgi:hypothetical protein